MNDFIEWKDWWSEKYRFQMGEAVRYFTFKIALNVFHDSGMQNIVETGTTRAYNDMAGGGMATVHMGDYAKRYGKRLYTVDISPEAIKLSKEVSADFAEAITYVESDSVLFLQMFPEKIGLLYLDSMDCPINDAPDSPILIASQKHQLAELEAAWDKLTDKSVILLDDNDFTNGGKCKLSKQFLKMKGWRNLMNDKQSLWIK